MYEPTGVYYIRLLFVCLVFTMLYILILFKLYCSAQWSTIAVLLCFINKMNENEALV